MNETEKQKAANGIVKVNTLSEIGNHFAPVASSAGLKWHGFSLECYRLQDNAESGEKCFNRHIIAFQHTGFFKETICLTGGKRIIAHCPGDLILYPAHFPSSAYDAKNVNQTILYLEPFFVEHAAQDLVVGGRVEFVAQPRFENEFIGDIGKHLLAEVESGGATGNLYAESLAIALAAKLIKNYSTARIAAHDYKGGLSKHNLRLVTDFINENLSEDLSLDALAALCGLSLYHFARMFKQSTEFAPHQFVIKQRIELAKRLLRETDLQIVEICLRVGFESQNHFTTLFRRHTGATPKIYRDRS